MNPFEAIEATLKSVEQQNFKAGQIWLLNPKDRKRLHVDKISIRFMEMIKRNRKHRRRNNYVQM